MNNRNIIVGDYCVHGLFERLISIEHLFASWDEFRRGNRDCLVNGTYLHSGYTDFYVTDPKLRHIHKPSVRDRVLHHALVRLVGPIFESRFISTTYSSRVGKGTHKAIKELGQSSWRASAHNTKTVWALKCDIRKFFDSVDHEILLSLIRKKIRDPRIIAFFEQVIRSLEVQPGKGIPLGNLTSQLFSNIYLDRLDQFLKRELGTSFYLRYADDFILLSQDQAYLESLLSQVEAFLEETLLLELHWRKVEFRRWRQGIDFLGTVVFPAYQIQRLRTSNRIIGRASYRADQAAKEEITSEKLRQSLASLYGTLYQCRGNGVFSEIEEAVKARLG